MDRNNQGVRTCGDHNNGSGRQAYRRINVMTQREAEQDPKVITSTLLVFLVIRLIF